VQNLVAVVLALVSAVCYAAAAVLQHREASLQASGGLRLVARLVRRRGWWTAIAATLTGALLHLAALGAGPLVLVQPLGVTALVFGLVIQERLGGGRAPRRAWAGAACVVLGLPAVLSALPRHAGHLAASTPALGYWWAVLGIALLVGVAELAAACAPRHGRFRAVLHAVAAALCFGLTSGTVKAVWLGHLSPLVVGAGLASALVGVVLAQHAYRDGGLGAPLATLTLVDPLTAGTLGVLVLGEPLSSAPLRLALGVAGAAVTAVGVVLLSPRPAVPGDAPKPPMLTAGAVS
jgi:drug/metabolite transporter (DMT)-like permease